MALASTGQKQSTSTRLPMFVTRGQAFEKMDIGLCVKDAVLMVKETRVVQIDRAEYLLGMTLAGRGNQRLAALAGPGLVQCRILAKTGFVLENQCGFFSGRFFLRLGYVYRCHRCCCALSAWARRRFGRALKSQVPGGVFAHGRDGRRHRTPR